MARQPKTQTQGEAFRYLANARDILKHSKIEDDIYLDKKPVREAFGTAYLAVLEAINEALIEKGLTQKELPKSVDGYRAALKKFISVHNGKLIREFEFLYETLHIGGYYRGLIYGVDLVKDSFKHTESFINKLVVH
ncbi:MAG: DUF5618 family protein [Nitrospirae bacterium]|nr:DUF5618 family protein [Nitrospirota bacterium]MBF0533989.1 DUF5618 family protein [Nitrospirota bacterium]MBF0616148.1 DUF5618 family protein [Nitrospirota bacterium]